MTNFSVGSDWLENYATQFPSALENYSKALQTQSTGTGSALDQYMQTVAGQQNGGVNTSMLAYASALMKPTKTGSFFESMGNAGEAAVPEINKQRGAELERAAIMAKLQMAKAGLGAELAQKQMELINAPVAAQGKMLEGASNQQDLNWGLGGSRAPAAPGVPPGQAVPQSIRRSDAEVPGAPPQQVAQGPDVTAPPVRMPGVPYGVPMTPDAPPAIPAPAPAIPSAPPQAAPPPSPPPPPPQVPVPPAAQPGGAYGTVGMDASGGGDGGAGGNSVLPPPPVPAPPPGAGGEGSPRPPTSFTPPGQDFRTPNAPEPLPKDYKPGQINLGGGIVGIRPPAPVARQLDAATRIMAGRDQFRLSKGAAAQATAAQQFLEKQLGTGFTWDAETKAIVPIADKEPLYQQRSKYAESAGAKQGQADNTLIQRPANPDGTGPLVDVNEGQQLRAATAAGLPQTGGVPTPPGAGGAPMPGGPQGSGGPNLTAAPSEMTKLNTKQAVEYHTAINDSSKQLPQMEAGINTIKNDILPNYKTGMAADLKKNIAGILRAAGADVPEPDDANFEIMTKQAMNQVFASVKDIGGRVLASEIMGLQKAVFSPDMSPKANRELVASLSAITQYQKQYISDYRAWRAKNPDNPDYGAFTSDWQKEHKFQEFKNRELTETVAKGAEPISATHFNPPEYPYEGQVINAPKSKEVPLGLLKYQDGNWLPQLTGAK